MKRLLSILLVVVVAFPSALQSMVHDCEGFHQEFVSNEGGVVLSEGHQCVICGLLHSDSNALLQNNGPKEGEGSGLEMSASIVQLAFELVQRRLRDRGPPRLI